MRALANALFRTAFDFLAAGLFAQEGRDGDAIRALELGVRNLERAKNAASLEIRPSGPRSRPADELGDPGR